MLKYEIGADQRPTMTACGNAAILAADTLFLVKMIFDSIRPNNPKEADAYVHAIAEVLQDPESPMWLEVENEQPECGKGD